MQHRVQKHNREATESLRDGAPTRIEPNLPIHRLVLPPEPNLERSPHNTMRYRNIFRPRVGGDSRFTESWWKMDPDSVRLICRSVRPPAQQMLRSHPFNLLHGIGPTDMTRHPDQLWPIH